MVAVLSILPLAAQSSPPVPKLMPVDEAPSRPDFLAFRQELQRIIERNRVPALLEIPDPNIKNGFGGDDGIEAFKRKWEFDSNQTPVRNDLRWILAHGGSFIEADTFAAPYVYSRWPDRFDPFEHVALTGSQVRIRSATAEDAAVLVTLRSPIVDRLFFTRIDGRWKMTAFLAGD